MSNPDIPDEVLCCCLLLLTLEETASFDSWIDFSSQMCCDMMADDQIKISIKLKLKIECTIAHPKCTDLFHVIVCSC